MTMSVALHAMVAPVGPVAISVMPAVAEATVFPPASTTATTGCPAIPPTAPPTGSVTNRRPTGGPASIENAALVPATWSFLARASNW